MKIKQRKSKISVDLKIIRFSNDFQALNFGEILK